MFMNQDLNYAMSYSKTSDQERFDLSLVMIRFLYVEVFV